MPNPFQVKIIRLPLPLGPLEEGHPEPKRRPIGPSAEFTTEVEAFRYALTLQNDGYGAAVIDPEGNEWISIKERATRLFQEERTSLTRQLRVFEGRQLTGDTAEIASIRNKILELDQHLGSL
jgi:hypothetical protein